MIRLLISRQWQKDLRIPFANEIVLYLTNLDDSIYVLSVVPVFPTPVS